MNDYEPDPIEIDPLALAVICLVLGIVIYLLRN